MEHETREKPRLDDHGADRLLRRLNAEAVRIAGHFGLVYRAILAEEAPAARHYGICYEDGLIKIRLRHATRGTPLKYSSLVHTLCHEMAHLRHFDHGESFRGFLAEILAWARKEGIYRPRISVRSELPPQDCALAPAERLGYLEEMRRALEPRRAVGVPRQLSLFEESTE